MIVTQAAAPVYPQLKASTLPAPAPDAVNDTRVEPTAKGGARGLALLASDTAAIILAEQSIPPVDTPAAAPVQAGLDLRGRDLREVDLSKLDLRGADLSDANLSGKDLTGLDLQGATMTRANLDGTNLTDTNLNAVSAAGASFKQASFARTNMNDADFSGAMFNKATFQRGEVGMTQDDLEKIGIGFVIRSSDFTGANLSDVVFKEGGGFHDSKLDGAKFDRLETGYGFGFSRSSLKNATFKGLNGKLAIGASDASGADFTEINNASVNIGESKVDGLSFKGSSFRVLTLSNLDLTKVDMSVANKSLRGSRLTNNIMTNIDLSGFDFTNSRFTHYSTSMENTLRSDKERSLADAMTGTNLRGAIFKGVTFDNFDIGKALVDAGALANVTRHVDNSFDKDLGRNRDRDVPVNRSSETADIKKSLSDGTAPRNVTQPTGKTGKLPITGVYETKSALTQNATTPNIATIGQALLNAGAFGSMT